jgi:hypothetical protein
MTFQEIFKNPGLYVADSFAEGVAFRVNERFELYVEEYKDVNDLLPETYPTIVYGGLFEKDYKKILLKKNLFKEEVV